jgi:muramidase (phage lysozyme)
MGGKTSQSTQSVSIPPEVLARYNSVNARAEQVAQTPFQPYTDQFVAGLTPTQTAGIQNTSASATQAQPYYNAATGLTLSGAQDVGALNQNQIGYYQNPYTQAVAAPTLQALQQQQGQERSQQQAQAIKSGAAFGERSGLQRAQLAGQQNLATAQAIAPIYQQGYQQAVNTAQGQQGVVAADLARRMQAGQQVAGIGTAAQQAGLQGAQAQIAAGTVEQQTQQADLTAKYQQFLQQRGYDFQTAQFLANIAMGTGSLSGSTTTTTQPQGFFSDERLKHDAHRIGETDDGLPIYSFKYNGDNKTQIGLMAQDVEKRKPEAVGLAPAADGKMYKTVDYDKATRQHKDYGGGVMGDYDASSMGGAVAPGLSGEGFADGGMPGMPNAGGMPGVMGYVPSANLPIGKLITADPKLLRQNPAGLGSAVETGKNIAGLYDMGKSGIAWGKKQIAANGGLIVPRQGYAMGGGDDEEPTPYNPSEVMSGEDPMKDVLRSGSQFAKSLPKPGGGGGGGGGQSGASQLTSALGLANAGMNFAEEVPAFLAMFADGGRTPFAYGGLTPRQGYQTVGRVQDVPADYSPEADLPSPDAQEASLVVDQPRYKIAPQKKEEMEPHWQQFINRTYAGEGGMDENGQPRYNIRQGGKETFDPEAGHPGPGKPRGGESSAAGAGQFINGTWNRITGGAPMTPGYQDAATKELAMQDYKARTGRDLDADLKEQGLSPQILKTLSPTWTSFNKGLSPPNMVGRSERAPSSYSGKGAGEASLGDVVSEYLPQGTPTSANFWVPALAGLGSMLASKNQTLLGAVGEGLVGGTGAYMSQQKQESELEAQKPITAARNVEALNALSLGLKKYNAFNRTNLTLAEFAKLKPSEIAKFAGVEAAKAASGSETAEPKYTYTPDEMSNLVIDRNGVKIPAASDPGYLTGYKAHYALYGDDPYGKAQMEFADKQLAATKDKTLSASGEYIPTPGAISSGQQGLNAQQKVEGSIKFENTGDDFRRNSVGIVNNLEALENAFSRFKTGRDAVAKANLDNILTTIDPNNKYRLSSGAGADYDTIMKSAVALQLAQLSGLSARAPAAELNALNRVSPTANLNPDAVRKIIINAKAHNAYQQKMYDEYHPEQWGYDSTKYQKDFMNRNNYKEFLKEIEKSVPAGAGTEESRKVAPIPQSNLVVGKVYKDASGKEMRRTSSGWEKP